MKVEKHENYRKRGRATRIYPRRNFTIHLYNEHGQFNDSQRRLRLLKVREEMINH